MKIVLKKVVEVLLTLHCIICKMIGVRMNAKGRCRGWDGCVNYLVLSL